MTTAALGGTTRHFTSRLDVEERSLADAASIRALAAKFVSEKSFLSDRHLEQIEALLNRLAARRLPVFKVVRVEGAGMAAAPGGAESSVLPPGALFLARERRRCPAGWCLRLAGGGGWIVEVPADPVGAEGADGAVPGARAAEGCGPSQEEARAWLEKCRGDLERGRATGRPGGEKPQAEGGDVLRTLTRNARAVLAQAAKLSLRAGP